MRHEVRCTPLPVTNMYPAREDDGTPRQWGSLVTARRSMTMSVMDVSPFADAVRAVAGTMA